MWRRTITRGSWTLTARAIRSTRARRESLFRLTHIANRRNRYLATHDGQKFLAVTALPDKKAERITLVFNRPRCSKNK